MQHVNLATQDHMLGSADMVWGLITPRCRLRHQDAIQWDPKPQEMCTMSLQRHRGVCAQVIHRLSTEWGTRIPL